MSLLLAARLFLIASVALIPAAGMANGSGKYQGQCLRDLSSPGNQQSKVLLNMNIDLRDYCKCLDGEVTKWVKQGGRVLIGSVPKKSATRNLEAVGLRRGHTKCVRKQLYERKSNSDDSLSFSRSGG